MKVILHELKTIDPHFTDVWEGRKTFEIRKLDRDFKVAHQLRLLWYQPSADGSLDHRPNRVIVAVVTHILTCDGFPDGIKEGYGVLSIKVIERIDRRILPAKVIERTDCSGDQKL